MKKKKLKLYVWENVFCDYTSGIAFALATSPDHARKLIALAYMPDQKTAADRKYWLDSVNKELSTEPSVVTRAAGFQQSGGG